MRQTGVEVTIVTAGGLAPRVLSTVTSPNVFHGMTTTPHEVEMTTIANADARPHIQLELIDGYQAWSKQRRLSF